MLCKAFYTMLWKTRGHRVCVFKPFQTEERQDGTFPDLEVFKNECDLSLYYNVTLYFQVTCITTPLHLK